MAPRNDLDCGPQLLVLVSYGPLVPRLQDPPPAFRLRDKGRSSTQRLWLPFVSAPVAVPCFSGRGRSSPAADAPTPTPAPANLLAIAGTWSAGARGISFVIACDRVPLHRLWPLC